MLDKSLFTCSAKLTSPLSSVPSCPYKRHVTVGVTGHEWEWDTEIGTLKCLWYGAVKSGANGKLTSQMFGCTDASGKAPLVTVWKMQTSWKNNLFFTIYQSDQQTIRPYDRWWIKEGRKHHFHREVVLCFLAMKKYSPILTELCHCSIYANLFKNCRHCSSHLKPRP